MSEAEARKIVEEGHTVARNGGSVGKQHEAAAQQVAKALAAAGKAEELRSLLQELRPWFTNIPKVRTAKLVRALLHDLEAVEGAKATTLAAVQETQQWADETGQALLKQALGTQLASLYFKNERYGDALTQVGKLLKEIKRLDDKQLQVEVQLLESHIQHALRNNPKARAALTAARTAANAIYCPPLVQAQIDMQAGVLHAEEKDYKTAYSYFYECFEGYALQEDATAIKALKYMLLCKIMTNSADDITQILTNKAASKHAGRDIDAMKAIAAAYKERSLKRFTEVRSQFAAEIDGDAIVHNHLATLYDNLLEQNLLRIIEPFSCVEVSHIADLIQLPGKVVERKLSQMILDKKFDGVLDAANGCLHVWDEEVEKKQFDSSLETISQMNKVVSSLFENCAALN